MALRGSEGSHRLSPCSRPPPNPPKSTAAFVLQVHIINTAGVDDSDRGLVSRAPHTDNTRTSHPRSCNGYELGRTKGFLCEIESQGHSRDSPSGEIDLTTSQEKKQNKKYGTETVHDLFSPLSYLARISWRGVPHRCSFQRFPKQAVPWQRRRVSQAPQRCTKCYSRGVTPHGARAVN